MRVLINAASAHMGGALTYLQNVLRWLPELAPADTFVVFAPAATVEKLQPLAAANVRLAPYPFGDTGGPRRLFFDQVYLPYYVRRHGIDLLFSSTGFGTFVSPCPQVLLIRNLAYFDPAFRERYRALGRSLRKNTLRRWHSLLSAAAADVVLYPTRAMQAVVEAQMPLRRARTEALHYGFDHEAFRAGGAGTPDVVAQVRRWKAEGYKVLLNVSTYAVHKNYETLVDALPLLRQAGVRVKLLLTISREKTTDTAEYDALRRRITALGEDEAYVELGYVPYGQLGTLYAAADAYVFPSFSESFGHTMVEAMAAGLPVVAADTAVNREVCGAAGVYFSTFDAADCARTLQTVLGEPGRREALAAASAAQARRFSWQDYTERLLAVFAEAAGNGHGPAPRRTAARRTEESV